jgi:hypothetical protein
VIKQKRKSLPPINQVTRKAESEESEDADSNTTVILMDWRIINMPRLSDTMEEGTICFTKKEKEMR